MDGFITCDGMPITERLISVMLFATAGGGSFLVLLNRGLLKFRDNRLKKVIIVLTGGGMSLET